MCLDNKRVETAAIAASATEFEQMAAPGMLLGLECGNMYAGKTKWQPCHNPSAN